MNWNQLQYVITIAEEKSITKAAQKLYISQPSLSLSIQALEKETGTSLFERNRGEMKLTYAGSLFYEWAVSTLHSHTQLEWKLGDIVSGSRTLIRLGLSPHRSERLLAPVLERFYSMYENCDIQIIEQPTYILRQMLEEDKLDLILDISSPDTINFESELLVKESFVLAIPDSLCPFPIHHQKGGHLCHSSNSFTCVICSSIYSAFRRSRSRKDQPEDLRYCCLPSKYPLHLHQQ